MKRFFIPAMCALMLLFLAACSGNEDNSQQTTTEPTTIDGIVLNGYDENGNPVSEVVSTTRFQGTTDPMTNITVVIPDSFIYTFDAKYQENLQLYCTDNGFTSFAQDAENGTVSFNMPASVYNTMLYEKRRELNHNFIALIESEAYPYFNKYINNEDYTEITLYVDKAQYESDSVSALLTDYIGDSCMHLYQVYTTSTYYHCKVTVKDNETGDVLYETEKLSVYSR